MKAGIGYCNDRNAFESGRIVATEALGNGPVERADLLLAFCNGGVAADEFFKGLRSVVGAGVPILGGSAIGIITNDDLSYEGFPSGAAALQFDGSCPEIALANAIDRDERQAGKSLAEQLSHATNGKLLLMFYDSVKASPTSSSPPIMNASPPLIAGIEEVLPACVPVVGAGVLGDYDFGPTYQFCGSAVARQAVAGALIGGKVEPYVQVMHGCTLKDGIYYTITGMQGPVISTIDDRPVVALIDEIYGDQSWRQQVPVRRLAIGVNYGDKFGDFREDSVVTRLIAGALPDESGIVLFEPDLEEGMEIQFMLRDAQTMIDSARDNSVALMQRITQAGQTPRLALYIDCAGRAASISETLSEEAAEVQAVMNQYQVPLLGFYGGVEVAPFLGKSRGLDWTGVLLVLAEE